MDPAQGLPDLFPQLKCGADLLGTLLCQHCDLRDHDQTGQQVGHTSAAAFDLVIGAFVSAERRRDDPVDFNPASGGAAREGSGTPTERPSPLIRFAWPVRRHVTMAAWSMTDLKRPVRFRAIEPGWTAFASTETVSAQSARTSPSSAIRGSSPDRRSAMA